MNHHTITVNAPFEVIKPLQDFLSVFAYRPIMEAGRGEWPADAPTCPR